MEQINNVTTINGDALVTTDSVTTTNTVGIAETKPYTINDLTVTPNTQYMNITTPYIPHYSTTSTIYTADLQVKRAENGYVINFEYKTHVAKNEKELNKLIVQLLNPNKKGKKNGKA